MLRTNNYLIISIISLFALVSCSCNGKKEEKLPPSLSFVQDEVSVLKHNQFDVSSLLTYKNVIGDIKYSFEGSTDIATIQGNTLIAEKVGQCTLLATYENLSDSILVNVVSQKPTIQYSVNDYEFDLTNGSFNLLDYVSFSSADVKMSLTSDRDDYSFAEGKITFSSVGDYTFSLTITEDDETSEPYNFLIYVYDSLKLCGRGTASDPFLISTASELKRLSDAVLNYTDLKDKYFLQTEDIDISVYLNWQPIGTLGIPFEGIYNGNDKMVTGLHIETHESWQGLFGFSSGTIKNLTVKGDINIIGTDEYVYFHSFAAGVCGGLYNSAIVSNCTNYVNVFGHAYVGGIVGGIARSDEMIVGRNQSKIINCKNYGTITGNDEHAINENAMYFGGICGESLGILTGNTNYGDVVVTGSKVRYVGGVCGLGYTIYKYGMYDDEDLEIYASNDNINYGSIKGNHSVGGVFGANVLPIHNCVNYGKVEASVCAGGVSGLNGTSTIKDNNNSVSLIEGCTNHGEVYASTRYAGGITSYSYFDVKNCVNNGSVHGEEAVYAVGGIVGYNDDGSISNCINTKEATITAKTRIGGLVGQLVGGQITDSYNYANVVGTSQYIGGLAGVLGSDSTAAKIMHSANYGTVTCTNNTSLYSNNGNSTGGIVGFGYGFGDTEMSYCYNYGEVNSISSVGGIVGFYKTGGSPNLHHLYNAGKIIATPGTDGDAYCGHVGGIVGMLGTGINLSYVYNTGVISGNGGQTSGYWRGVGGIVGSFYSGTIDHAYNFADVTANMMCAGIAGYSQNNSSKVINSCMSGGTITGQTKNNSGGMLGRGNYTTISNCVSFANVTPANSHASIYGTLNNGTNTNNISYSDTGVINDLLKIIFSIDINISSQEEAQALLDSIISLETQLNTSDNAILLLAGDENKTLADIVNETKTKLTVIVNGGVL